MGKLDYDNVVDEFIYVKDDQVIRFVKRDKLYVWNSNNVIEYTMINTISSNINKYRKSEVELASEARKLVARLCYPTITDIINQINNGSIINCNLSKNDFDRADDIWGVDVAILKGKSI
jgi:hypothetical protein